MGRDSPLIVHVPGLGPLHHRTRIVIFASGVRVRPYVITWVHLWSPRTNTFIAFI